MTAVGIDPRTCPTCGGYNPALRRDAIPKHARYCTPLSCGAWTITARLTKEGPKPLRPDERADLRSLPLDTVRHG